MGSAMCKLLREDIAEGEEVFVVDLDGLGRTLTLICADMEADQPGHWLIKNVGVDWLYAPIMDRSIEHRFQQNNGSLELKPWVVSRAEIAVQQGADRAIVVNSLVLSHLNNLSGAIRPYLPFRRCGWAFLLDASDGTQRFQELVVDLPADGRPRPIVKAVQWLTEFKEGPKMDPQ